MLKKTYISNKFFLILIHLFVVSILFSLDNKNDIQFIDSVNIRKQFFLNDNWASFTDQVLTKIDRGNKFIIIVKKDTDSYQLYFYSPINEDYLEKYNYGGFAYFFDKNRELQKVKVYIHHKHDSYLYFDKIKKGKADLFLFGKFYRGDISYYFDIDSLRFLSFNSVKSILNQDSFGEKVLIEENTDRAKVSFIEKVIKPALSFKYVTDGGRDQFGQFVFIKDESPQPKGKEGLNCSGFLKETVDNYIRLKVSDFKWLDIKLLKERRLSERVHATFRYNEIENDSFFGYDWVKNLADQINSYYNYNKIKAYEYDKDEYLPYTKLRGYDVRDLYEIVFRDQQKDASYFYILVFNRIRKNPPIIYEANHVALLVPYFKNYHFYTRVFESCEETSFESILKYRGEDKVLIIKVPLPISYL